MSNTNPWAIIWPVYHQGRISRWSIPGAADAVKLLQVILPVSATNQANYTALLHHLQTVPNEHPETERLRIQLDYQNEAAGGTTQVITDRYVSQLQHALDNVRWIKGIDVALAIVARDSPPPPNWQYLLTSIPLGNYRLPQTTVASGSHSSLQVATHVHGPHSTHGHGHPENHAIWTVVRPAIDIDTDQHLHGWYDLGNFRPPETISHLQIDLGSRSIDSIHIGIHQAWLKAIPAWFPGVRFLRLRLYFPEGVMNSSHSPLIARWVYKQLYPTLAVLQWPHRVDVLLAINDQEVQYNQELVDVERELQVDVPTALLLRKGFWQPISTIEGPSNTDSSQTTAPPAVHLSHAQATSTQRQRPLYIGYGFASESRDDVVHFTELSRADCQHHQDAATVAASSLPNNNSLLSTLRTDRSQLPDPSSLTPSMVRGVTELPAATKRGAGLAVAQRGHRDELAEPVQDNVAPDDNSARELQQLE